MLNKLLLTNKVKVKFSGTWPLKKGVTTGRLISIAFGGLSLTVLPDGYKHARTYAASFWEVSVMSLSLMNPLPDTERRIRELTQALEAADQRGDRLEVELKAERPEERECGEGRR